MSITLEELETWEEINQLGAPLDEAIEEIQYVQERFKRFTKRVPLAESMNHLAEEDLNDIRLRLEQLVRLGGELISLLVGPEERGDSTCEDSCLPSHELPKQL